MSSRLDRKRSGCVADPCPKRPKTSDGVEQQQAPALALAGLVEAVGEVHRPMTQEESPVELAAAAARLLDPSDGLVAVVMSDAEAVTAALQHPGVQRACRGDGVELYCLGLEVCADRFPGWNISVDVYGRLGQRVRDPDEPATAVFLTNVREVHRLSLYMEGLGQDTASAVGPRPRRLLVMTADGFKSFGYPSDPRFSCYSAVFLDGRIELETLEGVLDAKRLANKKTKKFKKDISNDHPFLRRERLRAWVLDQFAAAKRRVQLRVAER